MWVYYKLYIVVINDYFSWFDVRIMFINFMGYFKEKIWCWFKDVSFVNSCYFFMIFMVC